MSNSNKYLLFIVTFLTIVVARLSVVLVPNVDIVILGFVVHHFWYGVLFLIIGLLIPFKYIHNIKLWIVGIGVGFVIDELIFMILGGGGDVEYWSYTSIIGTLLLVIIFFISKERSTRWLGTL